MTQFEEPVYGVAPLDNVSRLSALIMRCQDRHDGLPGMGCLYGRSGLGKTTAAIHAVNAYNACHIEALPVGGTKSLMNMLVIEMGLKPQPTTEKLFMQAVSHLLKSPRTVLIDEADQVLNDRSIELIRRLHDMTQVPVILLGEEMLPQKLQRWERVSSRILGFVGMAEATARDVDHLARIYAKGLDLSAELKAQILRASRGSIRNVATNLAGVAEYAMVRGLSRLDGDALGGQPLHTGEAPAPRYVASNRPLRRGAAA
ncbi:AAA family ATPase [Tabrizicola fusiformis]|uniref:AAA family ATPase n=1 Tax=Tabrizicola sp. SY72 TaxID=2741673 RepID=UPI0015720B59|nr:AAA family ATPase [Tabrizicola sp. SY72]NTT86900.1 AAA family ATPase [Tabrizicola sp. SY72]